MNSLAPSLRFWRFLFRRRRTIRSAFLRAFPPRPFGPASPRHFRTPQRLERRLSAPCGIFVICCFEFTRSRLAMERKGLFRQNPLTRPSRKNLPALRSARGLLQAFGDVLRQVASSPGETEGEAQSPGVADSPSFPSERRHPPAGHEAAPPSERCSICLEPMLTTDSCIALGCFSKRSAGASAAPFTATSRPEKSLADTPDDARPGQDASPHRLHTVCFRQYVTFSLQNCQVLSSTSAREDASPGAAILRCPLADCRAAVPQSVIRRLLLSSGTEDSVQDSDAAADPGDDAALHRSCGNAENPRANSTGAVRLSSATLASPLSKNRRDTRKSIGSKTASWRPSRSAAFADVTLGGIAAAISSSDASGAAAAAGRGISDSDSAQKENQPQGLAGTASQSTYKTDNDGQELYRVYLQRTIEAYADSAGDVVRCLDPDCGYAFWWPVDAEWPSNEAERRGGEPCPKCKRRCLICGAAAHEAASCEEAWSSQNFASSLRPETRTKAGRAAPGKVQKKKLSFWRNLRRLDAAFEEYKKTENLRDCRQCGATVHLESGCHRMRCRCGYKFCYVCGTPNATCGCVEVQGHGFLTLEEVRQPASHGRRGGSVPLEKLAETAQSTAASLEDASVSSPASAAPPRRLRSPRLFDVPAAEAASPASKREKREENAFEEQDSDTVPDTQPLSASGSRAAAPRDRRRAPEAQPSLSRGESRGGTATTEKAEKRDKRTRTKKVEEHSQGKTVRRRRRAPSVEEEHDRGSAVKAARCEAPASKKSGKGSK
ncbi:hypothetical protein TGMAS_226050 [Toxoplasma gondii MAS]|uniref:IBR domain-containing protein n=1 Tax=Toxoplasma gondii MAS TaxID=943118 RepID=A0A086QN11_TOXGO|nr:hypothetical protein TGMAS_226050 [Toxoplasma gondii MAS]